MKGKSCLSGICLLILFTAVFTICTPARKVHASTLNHGTWSQAIGTSKSYSISPDIPSGWELGTSRWVLSGSSASITSSNKFGCTVEATGTGTVTLSCIGAWSHSYTSLDPWTGKVTTRTQTDSFTANWWINTGKAVIVSFNANGGSVDPALKEVVAGGEAVYGPLPTPTKSGYLFQGWTLDGVQVTGLSRVKYSTNHTLYAEWKKQTTYTIKFDGNGSTYGSAKSMSCRYGETYTLSYHFFRRDGYRFVGWNTKSDGTGRAYEDRATVSNLTTTDGAVITLYAMWSNDPIASGNCGTNISWVIDPEGCLIISGSGPMPDGDKDPPSIFGWQNIDYFYKIDKVVVKEGITHIGDFAFSRGYFSDSVIDEVELPNTLTSIGRYAFAQSDLRRIQIPDSVTSIGDRAFSDCEWLSSIELGTGISTIGDYAFCSCSYWLTDIHLPAKVQTIGDFAFSGCDDLQRITVDADNPYYTAKDGVLYDKSMTRIVLYPAGREGDTYIIPDGITSLSGFSSGKYTTLIIPATVKSIGPECFNDNKTLKEIYFRGKPPELEKKDGGSGIGMVSHAFSEVNCQINYPKKYSSSWSSSVMNAYNNAYKYGKPTLSWRSYSLGSSISNCTVTVDTSKSSVYDGTEKTPEVRVSDSGIPLIEGTEYKIEYGNNICAGSDTDEGAPYVKVTGLGDYAGTNKIKTFTIKKASQRPEIEVSANKISKGETAVITSAVGYGFFEYTSSDEKILTVDADGVITGVGDGTATVTARASGDDNYDAGSATVSITVHGHNFNEEGTCECGAVSIAKYTGIEITPADTTYSGEAQTASVRVTDQGTELEAGTDYEISEGMGTNAGTYEVVVTGMGKYADSKTVTWEIKPKELTPSVTGTVSKSYDGTTSVPEDHALMISLEGIADGDEVTAAAEFIYQDKNADTEKSVMANAITLEGDDKDNYCLSATTASANVGTITKADPEYTAPSDIMAVCGDTLSSVSLEGTGFSWEDDTAVLKAASDKEAAITVECSAVYTPEDTRNYNILSGIPVTVTVAHDLAGTNIGEGRHASSCKNCTYQNDSAPCFGGEATCSSKAVCSLCNTEYGELDPANHNWDDGTVTKAATCTQEGERTFTCQNDKTHQRTETIAIDENAHDYGSWEQCDEKQHKRVCKNDSSHIDYASHKFVEKIDKAATASEDGSKHEECLTCGYKKQSVRIPRTTGVPGAGTSLKDVKTGNHYTVVDPGNRLVRYTGPANKNVRQVSVPAFVTINGITYTVTGIGKNAFSGCGKLKTIRIGANVSTIGDKAFYKCKALTKIIIPARVKKIGKRAFYGCKKLKGITIKTTKLTRKKVGSKAFKGIHAKAKIKVPKKKLTSYKKILKAKGVGSRVKIKK